MTERGGPTTQSGIQFQNSIAAQYMAGLIDSSDRRDRDRIVQVRVEAPEAVDDTVVTYADGHKRHVQAKESIRTNEEAWEELWRDFREQFERASFHKGKDRLEVVFGSVHEEYRDLEKISLRARSAVDFLEFSSRLTQPQQKVVKEIERILFAARVPKTSADNGEAIPKSTGADADTKPAKKKRRKKTPHDSSLAEREYLLELFKHVDARTEPMYQVERSIVRLFPESNRSQDELFKRFRDRAGETARFRGSFDSKLLLAELEDDGIILKKEFTFDELKEIAKQSGAEIKNYKSTFGNSGVHLERPVTRTIVDWIDEASVNETIAVLLDTAGSGKTVILHDVLIGLESKGIPVLTLKCDLLSGVASLDDLEKRLGLDGSVERVLKHLSRDGRAVLLVDQIDALSLSLAKDLTTLDVVLKLVARARTHPRVRVIIACREFDLKNDPKLSRMDVSKQFRIGQLTDDEINGILKSFGIEFGTLPPSVQSLLRTPLHLDLFARVADEAAGDGSMSRLHGLNSLQDLYSALWELVIAKPMRDTPEPAVREQVLELMAERMNGKQEVSVPRSWLRTERNPDFDAAVNWLASHGIIIVNKDRCTLLHQTLFDYCYAKSFVDKGMSLYEDIRTGDQGLFVRSQILQVFNYARGVDHGTYPKDLLQSLSDPGIRFHIRDHLMRWFGSIPSPTDDEWHIAKEVFKGEHGNALRVYVNGNLGWFRYLKDEIVDVLLSRDDQMIDGWALPNLGSIFERAQAEVVEILRPFLDKGPVWIKRFDNLLWHVRKWELTAIELYEEVLRRSDESQRREFHRVEPIAKEDPARACKLVRIVLDREFDTAKKRDPNPITWAFRSDLEHLNGSGLEDVLDIVAEKEPGLFLDEILPWVEKLLSDAEVPEDFEYYHSDPLSSGLDYPTFVVQTQILRSIEKALVVVGRIDRERFLSIAAKFSGLQFETTQRLLTRAFTQLADIFYEEAHEFLMADRRRLILGVSEVFESRQLVKEITPHLNHKRAEELEQGILDLWNGKARHPDILKFRFRNQLYLLESFACEKLSLGGKKYLAELWRKFPGLKISSRPFLGDSGFVGSPIEQNAIEKMSDAAWLKAFTKYSNGFRHKEVLKGGARELAGVFAEQVKSDPERFYNLALVLPSDTEPSYVSALISGLASSESKDQQIDVIRRFNAIDDERLTQATASAISNRGEDVPDDILEAFERQLSGPADKDEESWRERDQTSRRFDTLNDSPFISLLNSRRGMVFRTVMRILDVRDSDLARERKWDHLVRIADTGTAALKSGVLEHLLYLYRDSKEKSVNLFERIVDESPEVLSTHFALEFLRIATPNFFIRLLRFIEAAMESEHESVQTHSGIIASLAQMYEPLAEDVKLAEKAVELAKKARQHKQPAVRIGAARVYGTNLNDPTVFPTCIENLVALVGDPDKAVQAETANVFTIWKQDMIDEVKNFVERFIESGIPKDDEREFGEFLFNVGLNDSKWALAMIRRYIERNPVTSGYRDGEYFIRLALRVYVSPFATEETKEAALTLFDDLCLQYSGAAQMVLNEWDRS